MAAAALPLFLLAACDVKDPIYDAANPITVSNDGHGTGTADPASAMKGQTVEITATPAGDYAFKQWTVVSGGVSLSPGATANPATFTMGSTAVEIRAEFEAVARTITMTGDGNGTATADPANAANGQTVEITATPTGDYAFKQWTVVSGGVTLSSATTSPATFTMGSEPVEIKAEFEAVARTITITSDGNGTATADADSAVSGQTVEITATPAPDSRFKQWEVVSGGVTLDSATGNPTTFTMGGEPVEIKAEFVDVLASGTAGPLSWILTSDGVLGISGTGAIPDFTTQNIAPWYSWETRITSAVIESGVTGIGKYAFSACSALESIAIPDGVIIIGESAFAYCSALESIAIPEGVTGIGGYAFSACSALESIAIPEGVTSIGTAAFDGCSALTAITLPSSLTVIGNFAFSDCSALTAITIPAGVTGIGTGALRNCSALTGISVETGNPGFSAVDGVLFDKARTRLICYPAGMQGAYSVPGGVTVIEDYAFSGCSALESIAIPEGVTSIGNRAFSSCSALTDVTIPEGVTVIGIYAFSGCSALTAITLPSSLTVIGDSAFSGCSALTSVTVLATTPPTLGSESFLRSSGATLYVPAGSVEQYAQSQWSVFFRTIEAIQP